MSNMKYSQSLYTFDNEEYPQNYINSSNNEPLLQKIIVKNNKLHHSLSNLFHIVLILFNSVLLVIIYLYVNQISNTLSILNSPNVTNAITQVENILDFVCKQFNISCL